MIVWQQRMQLEQAIRARTDLPMAAKVIAGVLLDHLNLKTGQCNPSRERIMNCAAAGRTTVTDAILLLQEKNIVSCASGGGTKSNSYSFPDLESTVSPSPEGAGIRPGPISDPVRITGDRGPDSGPEGAEIRPAPGRIPAPNKELNLELNNERNNTIRTAPVLPCDVWVDFKNALVRLFSSAGYARTPSDKGRVEEWKALCYKPKICLAVIRETIDRNKTIRALSWFDKPMANAHAGLESSVDTSSADVPIYEKTEEAKVWGRYETERGGVFNPYLTDARKGAKYALRRSRWPPGHNPALKDASHVAAELELITERRGQQ